MEQIENIFDAYAENDLADDQSRALCRLLRSSDAAVDWFVRECFLHWQLFALLQQRRLHAGVMEGPSCSAVAVDSAPTPAAALERAAPTAAPAHRVDRRAMFALAASLVAAVGALIWSFTRPQTVGQLTQATASVRWAASAKAPVVGELLEAGQELHLAEGRAQVTLVSGARIVMEGPTQLRVTGKNDVWLASGRMGATAPPQATGFVVDSPVGRFVDLGTEFTLDYKPDRSARLYVFTGMVDVQPVKGPAFKVSQSVAQEYDPASGKTKQLSFGDEQKISL